MASQKRKMSPQPEGTRRSRRKAVAPVRLGFENENPLPRPTELLKIQRVHPEDIYKYSSMINTIDDNLQAYATMLDFLPEQRSEYLEWNHNRIQKSRDRLEKLWHAYSAELERLFHASDDGIFGVSYHIRHGTHWYENGSSNLLNLDLERLTMLVDELPISDPGHFQKYLLRILPQFLQNNFDHESYYACNTLKDKLLKLEHALHRAGSVPSSHLSLQLCVSWIGELIHYRHYTRELRDELLKRVKCYLETRERTDKRRIPKTYYDTAGLRRQLLLAYHAKKCKPPRIVRSEDKCHQCYHRRNRAVLVTMGRDAWRETSWRVQLAVGHALPAELADLVLDFTLEAEGLTDRARFSHYDRKQKKMVPTADELQCGLMRACGEVLISPLSDRFFRAE